MFMLIRVFGLIDMHKIENNSCYETRLVRLFNIKIKE